MTYKIKKCIYYNIPFPVLLVIVFVILFGTYDATNLQEMKKLALIVENVSGLLNALFLLCVMENFYKCFNKHKIRISL